MTINPYEIMGLERSALTDEIKRRYRELAKLHHPDKDGDPDEWSRLSLAHAVLIDPERRARYDETGMIDGIDPAHDRQQAFELVASMITALGDAYLRADFSPGFDPRKTPVLETVRRNATRDLNEAEKALEVGRASLKFMQDYAKRVKRREDAKGVDFISAIMQEKIKHIEQRIAGVEGVIRVRKIALDVLAEYSFEHDATPTHTMTVAGVGTLDAWVS